MNDAFLNLISHIIVCYSTKNPKDCQAKSRHFRNSQPPCHLAIETKMAARRHAATTNFFMGNLYQALEIPHAGKYPMK